MFIPVVVATALPILIYLIIGFLPASRARTEEDYFVYSQRVRVEDYANTSVGYALQMAAFFLFAYWGAKYGLGALWTPLFWAFGFWLLGLLLPKFLAYHKGASSTMHQYMAIRFKAGRQLQILAAFATIAGLWGTMMAEVDYTLQVYSPVLKNLQQDYIVGAIFLIFGLVYIIINGFKAEVNTERSQVPVAYSAFLVVILCVIPSVWVESGHFSFWVVAALLFATLLILLFGKLQVGAARAIRDLQFYIPIVAVFALLGICVYTQRLPEGTHSSVLNLPLSKQLSAQGVIGLVSLFIANFLWMPVDLSTWQRIASVEGEGPALLQSLRAGTRRVLFESPATWMLGVVLGICIGAGGYLGTAGNPDNSAPLSTFAAVIASGNSPLSDRFHSVFLYPLFLLASVTVMLSTVHCMISAISFTAHKDLVGKPSIRNAKLVTALIVLLGMLVYPYLRIKLGANLQTVLYGAYSAQLSLFVVAILALLGRRLCARAAIASIVFGFAGTVVAVFLAIVNGSDSAAVLPPIFAVCAAIAGYIFFYDDKKVIYHPSDIQAKVG